MVWSWRPERKGAAEKNPTPSAGRVRREGLIRGLVGGAIGTLVFFLGHTTLSIIVWAISGFTLLAALLSPNGLYRWIQTGVRHLALAVGTAVSWLLLPIFFYGFCLLFGLIARRGRNDRLERWFDERTASYWKDRKDPPRTKSFYERQF